MAILPDDLHGKVQDPIYDSQRNPRREFRDGDSSTRKDGKWRYRYRLIDKNENKYDEMTKD